MWNLRKVRERPEIREIVRWYFKNRASSSLPFYCDATAVGHFAVAPEDLARGTDDALFRLFVALSMYQGLRDVVIMQRQRALSVEAVRLLADRSELAESIRTSPCKKLMSATTFDHGCNVRKLNGSVTCGNPSVECHVRQATDLYRRTGDMGKIPTSAFLHFGNDGSLRHEIECALATASSPSERASLLVAQLSRVHRVGIKLATMFVSALSVPALAPGLTPLFPQFDGIELVVVDTNVAAVVDALRGTGSPRTYEARAEWIRQQAGFVDLSRFRTGLPSYGPRLVQEAIYAFRSRSNRISNGTACSDGECSARFRRLCPFH